MEFLTGVLYLFLSGFFYFAVDTIVSAVVAQLRLVSKSDVLKAREGLTSEEQRLCFDKYLSQKEKVRHWTLSQALDASRSLACPDVSVANVLLQSKKKSKLST